MWVTTQKSFIEQQLPVFPESDNTHEKRLLQCTRMAQFVYSIIIQSTISWCIREKIHDQSQLGHMYSAS